MVINIISLNVRGLSDFNKRKGIFQYYKARCDILCLQETHSNQKIEDDWRIQWGGEIYYAHGTSNARGTAILINPKTQITVLTCTADTEGRWVMMQTRMEEVETVLCNIYAPNSDSPNFFAQIFDKMNESPNKIVVGDFNTVLNTMLDRKNSTNNNNKAAEYLNQICEEQYLEDPWRTRNPEKSAIHGTDLFANRRSRLVELISPLFRKV